MDAQWFKDRQRKAGVTSFDIGKELGRDRTIVARWYSNRQEMTVDQARVVAGLLGEPLEEVLFRAGLLDSAEKPIAQPGFRDAEAAPWVPTTSLSNSQRDSELKFAAHLGLQSGVDVWEVRSRSLSLAGYLPGDRILVDLRAPERAADGSVVVAQVYDVFSGTAKTVLRQFQRPALVSHSSNPDDWTTWVVDEKNASIRGVVIASWRVGSILDDRRASAA